MRPNLYRAAFALMPLVLALPAHAQDGDPFPNLIESIRSIEGVLGVTTAQTDDGKNVVFAWFADKAAALRWYHSPYHRSMQNRFFPNRPERVPLEHIAENSGPILAVASVTFGPNGQFQQIAIELYQPLPGGLAIGGTFAPESLNVPHMIRSMAPGQPTGGN